LVGELEPPVEEFNLKLEPPVSECFELEPVSECGAGIGLALCSSASLLSASFGVDVAGMTLT
jgi:hypothetical protein